MARGARINYKVGADTSQFKRAMAGVKSTVRGLGSAVKSAVAPIAVMTGAVSALTGVIAAKGIRGVVKLGAELDHLKDQTGISVRELILLRQAFEDNGVSAESVGKTVNRMQAAISEGSRGIKTYADAFAMLGLNVKDLEGMTVTQQFAAVAKAIAESGNAADKTNASLKIFGRSGAELAALFNKFGGSGDPFGDIDASIGDFAANMDAVSHMFERIDTLVGRWKIKFLAIFEPIVTKFIEPMTQVLEKIDKTSFTKFGEAIADSLAKVFNAFKDGKVGEILQLSIVVGLKKGAAVLETVFAAVFAALKSVFNDVIKLLPKGLQDVVNGLLSALASMLNKLTSIVANMLGHGEMSSMQQIGTLKYLDAGGFTTGSRGGRTFTDKGMELFGRFAELKTGKKFDMDFEKDHLPSFLREVMPNFKQSGNIQRDLVKAMFFDLAKNPDLAMRLMTPDIGNIGFNAVTSTPGQIGTNAGNAFTQQMANLRPNLDAAGQAELDKLLGVYRSLSATVGTGALPEAPAPKPGTGASLLADEATPSEGLAPVVSSLQAIGGGGGIGGLSLIEHGITRAADGISHLNEQMREQNNLLRGQAVPAVN